MKRERLKTMALVAVPALLTVPWAVASCATTDAGTIAQGGSSTVVPDASLVDAGDAATPIDAGCDESDPDCVTKPIGCDEAAWCPVPTNVTNLYALTAVWGSSKDDVWASGSGGTVLHWDGAAWKPTPLPSATNLPIKNTFHGLWGSGPNDVWVASATNVIFHTDGFKNGGAVWTRADNPTGDEFNSAPVNAVWGAAGEVRFGGRAFVLYEPNGDFGFGNQYVHQSADGGSAWTGVRGTATIHGIWGASADDVWIVADNSTSLPWQTALTMRGRREGTRDLVWTEIDSQAAVVLLGIWGSSSNDVWSVGEYGTIRHFVSGATAWEPVASPSDRTLNAVWGSGPSDVWAVGESGAILHWDGNAWTPSVAAFPVNKKRPNLYGVWGSGPNDVWIVGDGIVLHHTGGAK